MHIVTAAFAHMRDSEGDGKGTMRFCVVAAALVGLLVGSVRCQQLGNCPFPEAANITAIIGESLAAGDSTSTPTITLAGDFTLVCMAFGEQKDRLRAFSALVQYSCSGNSNCPGGTVIEQFEAECTMVQVWTNGVRNTAGLSRTESPMATASTTPREDCSFCASPAVNVAVGLPRPPDEVTHCVCKSEHVTIDDVCVSQCVMCNIVFLAACHTSCALVETTSSMRCFTADATGCCHVYVDGVCTTSCPNDLEPDEDYDCNCTGNFLSPPDCNGVCVCVCVCVFVLCVWVAKIDALVWACLLHGIQNLWWYRTNHVLIICRFDDHTSQCY